MPHPPPPAWMPGLRRRALLGQGLGAVVGLGTAPRSHAQGTVGVNALRIRVGQSAVFSGAAQDFGIDYRAGIQLGFDRANKAGGVAGRRLDLVSHDDAYEPKRTVDNTVRLIDDDRVFALIGFVATGNLAAALPVAEKSGVPMFAPLVGTTSFRQFHPLLIHVRASYELELRKILGHLSAVGVKEIAVVYQDSPFGKANLDTSEAIARAMSIEVRLSLPMDIAATDAQSQSDALREAAPGAVLMLMAGRMVEVFLKDYRASPLAAPIYTLSAAVHDAPGVAQRLEGKLGGVVTSRVVPSPRQTRYAIVADYQRDRKQFGQPIDSYTALEGYIAARVFTEGLRRVGRELDRERFVRAIEDLGTTSVAGFPVSYGPRNHNGSRFVSLEMYTRDGGLVR